jgi:hypothetical protein
MVQTKIWQITLFQNLILFTNHCGNLQEMLEVAYFLKYVDLYLTSEWGRFYEGHSVVQAIWYRHFCEKKRSSYVRYAINSLCEIVTYS